MKLRSKIILALLALYGAIWHIVSLMLADRINTYARMPMQDALGITHSFQQAKIKGFPFWPKMELIGVRQQLASKQLTYSAPIYLSYNPFSGRTTVNYQGQMLYDNEGQSSRLSYRGFIKLYLPYNLAYARALLRGEYIEGCQALQKLDIELCDISYKEHDNESLIKQFSLNLDMDLSALAQWIRFAKDKLDISAKDLSPLKGAVSMKIVGSKTADSATNASKNGLLRLPNCSFTTNFKMTWPEVGSDWLVYDHDLAIQSELSLHFKEQLTLNNSAAEKHQCKNSATYELNYDVGRLSDLITALEAQQIDNSQKQKYVAQLKQILYQYIKSYIKELAEPQQHIEATKNLNLDLYLPADQNIKRQITVRDTSFSCENTTTGSVLKIAIDKLLMEYQSYLNRTEDAPAPLSIVDVESNISANNIDTMLNSIAFLGNVTKQLALSAANSQDKYSKERSAVIDDHQRLALTIKPILTDLLGNTSKNQVILPVTYDAQKLRFGSIEIDQPEASSKLYELGIQMYREAYEQQILAESQNH